MAQNKPPLRTDAAPDQRTITRLQAKRLAAVSGIEAEGLATRTVADLRDTLQWQIDPVFLRFRRICGRVVKRDPATGVAYPVPNATVHVEDTDCDLLAYHPTGWDFSWYFPYRCRREVVDTVRTDECGRFCVWVPRFDVDWILRWRHSRLCFADIFVRPTIRDLIEERVPVKFPPRPPGPDPDPWPIRRLQGVTRTQLETLVGPARADALAGAALQASFGADTTAAHALLDAPAFDRPVPPPLPAELRVADDRTDGLLAADRRAESGDLPALTMDTVRASLAAAVQTSADVLAQLDLGTFVGPFRRCVDVWLPEWTRIVDVPDITFRVTQDVNGDGTEETIYGESHFQVRWNAGALPELTLEASPLAIATRACGGPTIPCGDVPALVAAGLMPLDQGSAERYYDIASGYGLRTNRPHPSGQLSESLPTPGPVAASPLCDTLQLYGCVRTNPAATHYRISYRYSPDGTQPLLPASPVDPIRFRDSWTVTWVESGTLRSAPQAPDADGWYPILPQLTGFGDHYSPQGDETLLLDWPTTRYPDGVYEVSLELGAGGTPIETVPTTWRFQIDNTAPEPVWTLEWRTVGGPGGSTWTPITFPCPVVYRGSPARELEFRARLTVSAPHLRSASLAASGCGAGSFVELPRPGEPDTYLADRWFLPRLTGHWHVDPTDTSATLASVYSLPSGAAQGTYSFHFAAASRAFNPAGADLTQVNDFYEEPTVKWRSIDVSFSVVDA